jgi:O-antigen/teichoic acid export membrane protein
MIPDNSIADESPVNTSSAACLPEKLELEQDALVGSDPNERHFVTGHLLTNLKTRTISSGFVTVAAQGAQFLLNLGSIMVLARLLTPQDFGLVAMVTTVMGFLRTFGDAGLSTATVQREGITHAQVSNLFWMNVAVGGLMSLIVAASAPVIARFYRDPRLVTITLALSITFLLAGLGVQHWALLTRQMRFKVMAAIQVSAMLCGVLVGVGMAWLKCGYWSLVGSIVSMSIVRLILVWGASRWRPQFFAPSSGTGSLLSFGANLTVGTFICSLARGSDNLLIGRCYGPDSIGLYSRASALLTRPLEQFLSPIQAVFLPAFSRLQTQPERYRATFLQVYETIALLGFFFTGLLLALAHPLTLVVLGQKWEQAAIILAGFTFAALHYPLSGASTWLFYSQGRGKDWLHASLIISLVTVASFVAGLPFGPAGVAIVYSASCLLIDLPILYWIAGRRGPVTATDLWMGFLRHLPVWGVIFGATYLTLNMIRNFRPFTELLICVPVGLLTGAVFICLYVPSRRAALSLVNAIQELLRSRKHLFSVK